MLVLVSKLWIGLILLPSPTQFPVQINNKKWNFNSCIPAEGPHPRAFCVFTSWEGCFTQVYMAILVRFLYV
jgi:hypothetical protein